MQQQREKEGQTHFQTTTASPSPSCRAHASQHHHPVLQIDPRDLQRLLDMGFHPKVAAQVRHDNPATYPSIRNGI